MNIKMINMDNYFQETVSTLLILQLEVCTIKPGIDEREAVCSLIITYFDTALIVQWSAIQRM